MVINSLTSPSNPKVKRLIALKERAKERLASSLFMVEGRREIEAALKGGYQMEELYFAPHIVSIESLPFRAEKLFSLNKTLYSRVSYRERTEGVIALFKARKRALDEINFSSSTLILVLEGVEKPGNLGAILRGADGVGASAVILCEANIDLYNPNTIRSSLGGLFTNLVIESSSEECFNWLKSKGVSIITAQLQDSQPYYEVEMRSPLALIFGSESKGLTPYWRERSDKRVLIPMLGTLDSLNLSVSTALLSYEFLRQERERGSSINICHG